jgi:hypothetical protein
MAFTTPKQWRDMHDRVAARDVEIERLVRAFFLDKFRAGGAELDLGDPTTEERAMTAQEKNQLRARVATLCNANSADYLLAVAP